MSENVDATVKINEGGVNDPTNDESSAHDSDITDADMAETETGGEPDMIQISDIIGVTNIAPQMTLDMAEFTEIENGSNTPDETNTEESDMTELLEAKNVTDLETGGQDNTEDHGGLDIEDLEEPVTGDLEDEGADAVGDEIEEPKMTEDLDDDEGPKLHEGLDIEDAEEAVTEDQENDETEMAIDEIELPKITEDLGDERPKVHEELDIEDAEEAVTEDQEDEGTEMAVDAIKESKITEDIDDEGPKMAEENGEQENGRPDISEKQSLTEGAELENTQDKVDSAKVDATEEGSLTNEDMDQDNSQGHEEWLSEGVLTDDDFHPSQGKNECASPKDKRLANGAGPTEDTQQNIEDALTTLEGGPGNEDAELEDAMDKKTKVKSEQNQNIKEETKEDDGNDTDDLLRMLGEDDNKSKKKLTKTVKDIRNAALKEEDSSDDDTFVFEGATAKKLKLSQTLIKKVPVKIQERDLAAASSDEDTALSNITKDKVKGRDLPRKLPRHTDHKQQDRTKKDKVATSTPLQRSKPRSLLKPASTPRDTSTGTRPAVSDKTPRTYSAKRPAPEDKPKLKQIEEEDFHLNETEFDSEFEEETNLQRMSPELAMQDPDSDGDSHSEDGSLYDELPSSDSEGLEDWFELDIRAEKAGDYLPLLGSKAKEMLLEEKRRCTARLSNLKQSLSALTTSGKKQAENVRTATMQLAELDDMLKCS